jgi:hypothetical protein
MTEKFIFYDDLSINVADVACFYKDGAESIAIVFKSFGIANRYWYFKNSLERDEKLNKINNLIGANVL